jgi:16S rRNA processing protein RimM
LSVKPQNRPGLHPDPEKKESLISAGQVVGTHGLRGDLKVRPISGDPAALLAVRVCVMRLRDGVSVPVEPVRQTLHKGQVLLRLRGHETLDAVEKFRGATLLLSPEQLPPLENDEFYWHQLEGALVIDVQRGELGRLSSMFSTAAHDTWVVKGCAGEVMIPVVDAFIVAVDLDNKRVDVDLPDGLIGLDA